MGGLSLLDVLLGRHGYGMNPEEETWWAWAFLLVGIGIGVGISALIF